MCADERLQEGDEQSLRPDLIVGVLTRHVDTRQARSLVREMESCVSGSIERLLVRSIHNISADITPAVWKTRVLPDAICESGASRVLFITGPMDLPDMTDFRDVICPVRSRFAGDVYVIQVNGEGTARDRWRIEEGGSPVPLSAR